MLTEHGNTGVPKTPEHRQKISASVKRYHARARAGIALLEKKSGGVL